MIESDRDEPVTKVPWWRLLILKETWAYACARFLIDPIWWFYLFWLPDFLNKTYHLDLSNFGPPLIAIYLISDVGSVLGGFSSSALMKRGLSVNVARKLTLLCVRTAGVAGAVGRWGPAAVAGGPFDRLGRGRASGFLGECLYFSFGCIAAFGGGLGDRHRRHDGGGRRHAVHPVRRSDPAGDGFISDTLHHRRIGVPRGTAGDPYLEPETAARDAGPA